MRKRLSIALTLALGFGMLTNVGVTEVEATTLNEKPVESMRSLDAGINLRELENDAEYMKDALEQIKENASKINFNEEQTEKAEEDTDSNFTFNGGSKYFLGMEKEFILCTLRSVGENVEVWVANDLSYGYDRPADVVTQKHADMMRDEFENKIYKKDTEFFGNEDYHDGTNSMLEAAGYVPEGYYKSETGKNIILITNVKDDSYYQDVNTFVAGFYWGLIERYIDRNIITIDSFALHARMPNDNPKWQDFQYDIFGTVAHEYQHLIHDDNDSAEETWINEGMSDFAQYLCGYGHSTSHVNAFIEKPENSLLIWGDYKGTEILADYGQAYLMQLYLNDHYGKDFVRTLATNGEHQGIESVNDVLAKFNTGIDFEELFRRFTIACAIDDPKTENGIYNFDSIDLKINYETAKLNDKDGVPAWGADYKEILKANKIHDIKIDGMDLLPIPWRVENDPLGSEEKVLWGNNGNNKDNFLVLEADLTNVTKATLKFDNYYQIEEAWDFGMVQVSVDNGKSWISLENEYTTSEHDPNAADNIVANLPGFTGMSGEQWKSESFDLSKYAGQKIHVAFRYMTDPGTNEAGWFIDNIEIPEIQYSNDCSSIEGFVNIKQLEGKYVEYALSFINEKLDEETNEYKYSVLNIDPMNVVEDEAIQLKKFLSGGRNYMIVWYAAASDSKDYVPFSYEITTKSEYAKNKKGKNKK
ncbi:choice-of-anchor J domain-containing protein [Oceanirhabdus sp. W0125-5]|uniref:choice-of-anchor J domain-containing protein n=1 Tax=Oceanirhabdus sp. W0125-5 TaxID=2999116 RepID=UPI0022F33F12|nr:choice-of-anchor J domain-containing protein [Oceanirhabdus sp. W0125-5]WBW98602.1 immune inhibitor A [Oceanirhabdus sp. W0125-5]